MNDNPQQNQPPAVTPPPAQAQQPILPQQEKSKSGLPKSPFLYAFLTFLLGIGTAYALITQFPDTNTTKEQAQIVQKKALSSLPKTAIDLKTCINKKGSLYADPKDIPNGPIFLLNDEKIIGLEYVFSKEDFEEGKLPEALASLDIQINHIQIASLSASYDGKPGSYYSVNLYAVDKKTKDAITCSAKPTSVPEASPSAVLSGDPEISASPAPSRAPSLIPALSISPTVSITQ